MGCGMGLIKYLLFIFNFIFALCGLAILIVGVLAHLEISKYADTVTSNIMFPSVTLIVIGSIIFIIAFFGCCGAIRESHCMTVTFASLLLTILIIQVAVAIYAFVVLKDSDEFKTSIREAYQNKIFINYGKDKEATETVDSIQSVLGCCGVDSYSDFMKDDKPIPWSCCGNKEGVPCSPSDVTDKGCVSALQKLFTTIGTALGGIALGIAVVELVGIIFALCLANSIKNDERRGYRV